MGMKAGLKFLIKVSRLCDLKNIQKRQATKNPSSGAHFYQLYLLLFSLTSTTTTARTSTRTATT